MAAVPLYNGPVETALRVLTLVEAFIPCPLSLEEIRLLDHFVVHAGDIGAPRTLHPPTKGRANAYTFRASLLSAALDALVNLEIVTPDRSGRRTRYGVEGATAPWTGVLTKAASPYLSALRDTGLWLKQKFDEEGHEAFFARLRQRIRKLLEEPLEPPATQEESFRFLAANYASDLERVAGTREGASILLEWAIGTGTSAPGLEYTTLEAVMAAADKERASILRLQAGLKEVMEMAG